MPAGRHRASGGLRSVKVLLVSATTEGAIIPVQPLGLACIAAAARGAGHETVLAELRPNEIGSLLGDRIRAFCPDVVGISVRNIDDQRMENPAFSLKAAREIIPECRRSPGAPIVLGGAGFSIFPGSVLAYLGADMGIQGEGEAVFPALLDAPGDGRRSDRSARSLPPRARACRPKE